MAIAKAVGNLSFKVLPDEMRKRFNGTMTYTGADATEKWVYAKVVVTYQKGNILAGADAVADDDYLMSPGTSVGVADKYRFLIMKNTGYTNTNENVTTDKGVIFVIDDGTPGATATDVIFLAPGDTMALKIPNCTVENLHAYTVPIANGVPTSGTAEGDDVLIEVAAILDDVA